MNDITLNVTGMTCGGCVNSVHKVLTALPGVQNATVTLVPSQAQVTFDPQKTDPATLIKAIKDAGFGASV